jgi:hypothetical protein
VDFRARPSSRYSVVGVLALLLSLSLVTRGAHAESAVTDAQRETARSLMDEGDKLTDAGSHEAALKRYRAADEIMRVPTTGIEVARALAALQRLVEARAQAIRVEHLPVVAGEPSVFGQARLEARDLELSLAARIPSVLIRVNPSDVPASVVLDQMSIPAASLGFPFKVNPGSHQLTVSALGYQSSKQEFALRDAENREIVVSLQRAPQSSGPLLVPAASDSAESSTSETDWSRVRGITGLAVGAAGLATGVVTGLITVSRVRSIKREHCINNRCDSAAKPELDKANTSAWVANISAGIGLVGVGYGLYELLWGGPDTKLGSAKQSSLRFSPEVSSGGWNLSLRGDF